MFDNEKDSEPVDKGINLVKRGIQGIHSLLTRIKNSLNLNPSKDSSLKRMEGNKKEEYSQSHSRKGENLKNLKKSIFLERKKLSLAREKLSLERKRLSLERRREILKGRKAHLERKYTRLENNVMSQNKKRPLRETIDKGVIKAAEKNKQNREALTISAIKESRLER